MTPWSVSKSRRFCVRWLVRKFQGSFVSALVASRSLKKQVFHLLHALHCLCVYVHTKMLSGWLLHCHCCDYSAHIKEVERKKYVCMVLIFDKSLLSLLLRVSISFTVHYTESWSAFKLVCLNQFIFPRGPFKVEWKEVETSMTQMCPRLANVYL